MAVTFRECRELANVCLEYNQGGRLGGSFSCDTMKKETSLNVQGKSKITDEPTTSNTTKVVETL